MNSKNKVYIIDNGGSYSGHIIWFVETEWPREIVEKCVTIASGDSKYFIHYLAAISDNMEWLGEIRKTSLEEYVCDYIFDSDATIKPGIEQRLPDDFIALVTKYWFEEAGLA